MNDSISTATKTDEDFDKIFNDRIGLNGTEAEKAAEIELTLNRVGVKREDVEGKGPDIEPISEALKASIDRNPGSGRRARDSGRV
jgi:hypothetical protein